MSQKDIMRATTTTMKKYIYSKGEMNINFTVDTGRKQDMKDLIECIEKAGRDIQTDLEMLHPKKK